VIAFRPFELTHSAHIDLRDGPFPTVVYAWDNASAVDLPAAGTHFGFVHAGTAEFGCASGTFRLAHGMYFAAPGPARIGGGCGLVVTRDGFRGFFHVGGPVEDTGRLRYIDGCTDSLLVPPVLKGDPCLNLLHLPPGTRQTPHTHPSLRVGLVVRGGGRCLTPGGEVALAPGLAFVIRAGALHSFHTDDEPLVVLAYHPDSDFGPTHEDHPMINRTIVSAGGGP